MLQLQEISLEGFKSIQQCQGLKLGSMNVLIGANGSGKSNFISFFKMLNYAMSGALGEFIGQAGGANSILHFGAKKTPQLSATLKFQSDSGLNTYHLRLVHGARDSLIFGEESITYQGKHHTKQAQPLVLGSGHKESALLGDEMKDNKTAKFFRGTLNRCRVYQFHDTSASAHIRNRVNVSNNRYLMSDGGNLAAVLALMAEQKKEYYRRIVSTIQLFAPFFAGFSLEPLKDNTSQVMLNWRAKGSEYEFGPHQLSDGTLRMMALTTLLLQPPEDLPSIIVIDEPELGLHPYAITQLCGLLSSVAQDHQVIVATQSVPLLNQFEADHVVVVEQRNGLTSFVRLEEAKLQEWLQEYSLGELWEKNVLGGRP
jgi:predicted ATPase